jgi:hypothetical protein
MLRWSISSKRPKVSGRLINRDEPPRDLRFLGAGNHNKRKVFMKRIKILFFIGLIALAAVITFAG